MTEEKQIEEMAKHCCFPCESEYNGECIEDHKPCECFIALETAKRLYATGYRKKIDVAKEIFAEIEGIKKDYAKGDIDGNQLYILLYFLERKYLEESEERNHENQT